MLCITVFLYSKYYQSFYQQVTIYFGCSTCVCDLYFITLIPQYCHSVLLARADTPCKNSMSVIMVTTKILLFAGFGAFFSTSLVSVMEKLHWTLYATHGEALHNYFSGHGTEVPFNWFSDTIGLLSGKAVPLLSATVHEALNDPFLWCYSPRGFFQLKVLSLLGFYGKQNKTKQNQQKKKTHHKTNVSLETNHI